MHGGSGSDDNLEINLTPLLDVVLQLIMFFMITVNFVARDQLNTKVQLPKAQIAAPLDRTADSYVFLNVDKEGKLQVREGTLPVEKLKGYVERERTTLQRTAKLMGKTGDVNVVIVLRADKDARYQQVWDAIDACMKAGYERWQLRVLKEREKK
jgi:biopolymer transport protein ExbD